MSRATILSVAILLLIVGRQLLPGQTGGAHSSAATQQATDVQSERLFRTIGKLLFQE
jgi:hypothetical protein